MKFLILAVAILFASSEKPLIAQSGSPVELSKQEMESFVDQESKLIKSTKPGTHALDLTNHETLKKYTILELKDKYLVLKLNSHMGEKPDYKIDKQIVAAVVSTHAELFNNKRLSDWMNSYSTRNEDYARTASKALGSIKNNRKVYLAVSMNYFKLLNEADRMTYFQMVSKVYSGGNADHLKLSNADHAWLEWYESKYRKQGSSKQEILNSLFP